MWAEPAAGCLLPAAARLLPRLGPDARLGLVLCGGNVTAADLAGWSTRVGRLVGAATPALIRISAILSPARVKANRLSPLACVLRQSAVTSTVLSPVATLVTVSRPFAPMNSASLQARMASRSQNRRPQSSTTPFGVKLSRKPMVSPALTVSTNAATGCGS